MDGIQQNSYIVFIICFITDLSIAFITNQHIANQGWKMATTVILEYTFNNLPNAPISFVILRAQNQGILKEFYNPCLSK